MFISISSLFVQWSSILQGCCTASGRELLQYCKFIPSDMCQLFVSVIHRRSRTRHQTAAPVTDSHQRAGNLHLSLSLSASLCPSLSLGFHLLTPPCLSFIQDQTEAQSLEVKKLFEEYNKMVQFYLYNIISFL